MAEVPLNLTGPDFEPEKGDNFSFVDEGMQSTAKDVYATTHAQLSSEEISIIKQKSHKLIDTVAKAEDPATFNFLTAEEVIAEIYGECENPEDVVGQEILWYFFNELYSYCIDCDSLSESQKEQCIDNVCHVFITAEDTEYGCPAIHSLPLPYKIIFGSLLSGLPQVPDHHLRFLQLDILYQLNVADPLRTSLLLNNVLSKQPPEAVVDYIHFLQSLGATGIQNDVLFNQCSIEAIQKQLSMLADHKAPIVRYAVRLARQELFAADEWHPDFHLESRTRVDESRKESFNHIKSEDRLLHSVVTPDDPSLDSLWKVRIASDAIGLMNNDGLLSHIMRIDAEDIEKKSDQDLMRYQSLLNIIDDDQSIVAIMAEIIELNAFASNTGLLGNLRNEGLDITDAEWCSICKRTELEAHLIHAYDDLTDQLFSEIAIRHEVMLNKFLEKIWYLIQDDGIRAKISLTYEQEISEFKRAVTYGYLLSAFEIGVNLLAYIKNVPADWMPNVDRTKLEEFSDESEQLFDVIKVDCDQANEAIQHKKEEIEHAFAAEDFDTDKVTKEILDHELGARKATRQFLEKEIDAIKSQRKQLVASSIHDLFYDEQLFPFGPEKARGMVQVLQQSHRPELRRMIEQDLGIQFEILSLKSQIHLMRFLMGQDDKSFDRLRMLLQSCSNPEPILESFLACSEDIEMGNVILDLAENKQSVNVLEKYAEIARQSEQISFQLSERMKEGGRPDLSSQYFYQALIQNANDSLRKAQMALRTSSDNSVTLQESLESLRIDRKQIDTIRLLTGAISKSDVNELDVSQISDLSFHSNVSVQSLSPELHEQLRNVVRSSFDHEQDYLEFDAFLQHPDATIYYTQCGDEILGMIGMQRMEDVFYLDWYATNKNATVRGWAEPTMRTVMKYIDASARLVCVSSPLSASCEALIEHAGLVATDVTDDGEYDEPYLRMRRVASDAALSSKGLKPDQINAYSKNAPRIEHDIKQGGSYKFAMVDKKNPASNAALFTAMKNLKKDGWILTRFVSDPENRSVHLCVFERDSAMEGEKSQIQHVFRQFKEHQASVASQSNSKDMRSMDTMD